MVSLITLFFWPVK